MFQAANN